VCPARDVCTDDTIALIAEGSSDLCYWVYAPVNGLAVVERPGVPSSHTTASSA